MPAPPAPFRSTRGPVHVVLVDKTSLYLMNVVIATDSLFGRSADVANIRYSMPLTDVIRIEEQRKSPLRTIALMAAIVIIIPLL